MIARLYCVVVVLLLLAEVSSFEEDNPDPGIMARITRKGLKYARQHGVANLKNEFSKINLHNFTGKFKINWIGSAHYEIHGLKINHFTIRNSNLSLLPPHSMRVYLSNNYVSVHGMWKVKKAFVPVEGAFNLSLDGISTSFFLNVSKDHKGQPTISMTHCNNSAGIINTDLSKKSTVCNTIRTAVSSRLQPYLRTLPVSSKIDYVTSIDYRLVRKPVVSSQGLDVFFKGEFFSHKRHTPAPLDVPAIEMPQKKARMVYFGVSEYVFNTASWAYHRARQMQFNIESTQIPLNAPIQLHTNSFQALVPKLAKLYPNMKMALEVLPETTPFLIFNSGNATLVATMTIQAYALLPKTSDHIPLFQIRAKAILYPTFNVISGKIVGFLTTERGLKLELKQSNVDFFDVQPMENIFNYYAQHTIYPSLNEKLEEGFPLPLPKATYLTHVVVRVHENFLLIAANLS